MRLIQPVPTVLLVLCLGACGSPPRPVASALAQTPQHAVATPAPAGSLQAMLILARYRWVLRDARDAQGRRIDALFVRADRPLRLDFNASTLSVGNACNTLSAHQTATAERLLVEPMATTLMACAEPAMAALDKAIGQRLQGTLAMRLADGDAATLVLTNAAGDVLSFAGVIATSP